MAWKESHKQSSREKILEAAADLFTRRGYSGVGIDEIMQAAGFTRGAFYAHFESKAQLFEEAMIASSKAAAKLLMQGENSIESVIANYLSEAHLTSAHVRCPLSSLVSDVGHEDERLKNTYTRLFKGMTNHLADSTDPAARDRALLQVVLMVGGMSIARSLNDAEWSKSILKLCKDTALKPV